MTAPTIAVLLLAATLVTCAVTALYVLRTFRWYGRATGEDRYFALPSAERRVLKQEVHRRGRALLRLIGPIARALVRITGRSRMPTMRYGDTRAPAMVCPRRAFELAANYEPDERDVFVATQMKCGTTWMQQIVYETLSHGRGDLGDDGHRHIYALSPWIESIGSVPLERGARIGERELRIIKTHLGTNLCPYSESARYIYVTRHPVSCFASCVDFVELLAGPFAPPPERLIEWYCSDQMWWRSWPEHVDGWWQWSQLHPNVLFIHYEEMLDDLSAAIDRVATFLDVALTAEERAEVVRKSEYKYMKANEEVFEMSPPSLLDAGAGTFMKSGKRNRDQDVRAAERDRIIAFCRERLADSTYPLARFYPDVAP